MCAFSKAGVHFIVRVVFVAAFVQAATAERAQAEIGCLSSAQSLTQSEIKGFIADPDALLARYPDAGPSLSAQVQRLAASDTQTLPALIALANRSKPAHVVAIGIGLGRAAGACMKTRPDLAASMKEFILSQKGPPGLRALFASESAVAEIAAGDPAVASISSAGRPDTTLPAAPADAPVAPSLEAALKSRNPDFLLPTSPGAPPPPPTTPSVAATTFAYIGSATSAATAKPAQSIGDLSTPGPSIESFATFSTASGPPEADQDTGSELSPGLSPFAFQSRFSAQGASGDLGGYEGEYWGEYEGRYGRYESEGKPPAALSGHKPSFGTGGLEAAERGTVSPTR